MTISLNSNYQKGFFSGIMGYFLWGMFPIYFHIISSIPTLEVLCHRILWGTFTLWPLAFFSFKRKGKKVTTEIIKNGKSLGLTSFFIGGNWLVFIHAIQANKTLDASFGYFINPVLIIFFGLVFFKESLTRNQKISLFLVLIGISYQLVKLQSLPWISLYLCITFGLYGVMKKRTSFSTFEGLFLEVLLLSPLALCYLFYLGWQGELNFINGPIGGKILLMLAGPITVAPLLLFSFGAKKIPLSHMGFIQYLTPTLHFLLGIYYIGEELIPEKLHSFIIIWIALGFLIVDSALSLKRKSGINS